MSALGRVARVAGKVLAVVVALALLVPVVGIAFLRTDRGHEVLRRFVVAQARKSLPGLQVGHLDGGLLRDLTLRDVELRDTRGAPAVHVERLAVRYRLLPLLRRRITIEDLQIQGLRVVVRPDPRGGSNLAHLTAPAAAGPAPAQKAEGAPWSIAVEHASIGPAWVETPDRVVTASLEGARFALDEHALAASLESLRVGGLLADGNVVALTAQASGPRDRVAAHVEAWAGGAGDVTADATVGLRPAGGGGTTLGGYSLFVNVRGLEPAAWAPGAPSGRLSLSLRADGEGLPPSAGAHANAELRLLPSELAGERLLGGTVRANIRGERWEVSPSELRAVGASLAFSGHGRGRSLVADVEGNLDGDEARLARQKKVRGHGHVVLHAAGTIGGRLSVKGHGDVVGLAAGDVRIGRAALSLDVGGTPAAPSGTVSVVARRVTVARGAPPIDNANVKVSGDRGRLQLQASARGPRLRAAVAAHGLATAKAGDITVDQLALDMTTPTYRQQLALVGSARARYRAGGEVMLDRTVVQGTGARFTGRAVLEGEYHPGASSREVLGRLALQLAGASTAGLPPVNAELSATLTRARGTVHLDATMPSAAARVQLDADVPLVVPRRGPPRLASRGRTDVHLQTNRVDLRALPAVVREPFARQGITGGTMSLDVTATGDVAHPEAHLAFELRDVMYRNLAGLGRDSTLKTVPGLGGTVTMDAKDGSIVADGSLLIRKVGVLELHAELPIGLRRLLAGVTPEQVPLRATVRIPGLRLSSLADFTDGLEGIDGQLHGRADLAGTLASPTGRADLAIDGARVDKATFEQVQLHAEAEHHTVRASLKMAQRSGGRLEGSLTLERGRPGNLEAYVTGKDVDVSFARPFLANAREIGGVAQLSATAKGTVAAPKLWASLSLEKGRVGLIGQPTFRDVRLAVALEPGRLDLNALEMSSGDGNLRGEGSVTLGGPRGLTPQAAVFTAHAKRFLVAVAGKSGARVDGDLAFEAALRADVLAGTVKVPNANVWLLKPPSAAGGGLQRVAPHADVHFVDAAAQAAAARELRRKHQAAASALRLALKATAGPVYVRGKDLDLEVRSELEIGTEQSGRRRGAITLAGAIHVPRGRIDIQGQRFDVDHADVRFDGSSDLNPALDIKLTRQFPEALVIVELRGTPRKPDLRLSSDPGVYDKAQIVSLILTGQTGSRPSAGKSFDPTSIVASAVLSRLADQVAPGLGLDVMRVEQRDIANPEGVATGGTDTRVEVGKYVTERVYISYAHVFGAPANANQNEAHLEYRMTRRWVLETVFGDAGQGGLDALWTHRF